MLNQLRRRPPPTPAVNDGYIACYGIVVACASLLLLTILVATVSIGKACALAGAVGLAFGLVGCLARWCANDGAAVGVPVPPPTARPCGDVAIDVLPAFAYTTRPTTDAEGSSKAGRRALCPVCLEDVQAGEMVRQLPACKHLFHVECIDMWLHSHSTCPLCRCYVWAQPGDAKPTPEADPPDNALPPV